MTNEDVIDLYNRAKIGTMSWFCAVAGRLAVQPRMALGGRALGGAALGGVAHSD